MATATPTTPGPTTITSIPSSSFCSPRLLLSHEDSERCVEFGSGEKDGDDDSYHNHQDALLLLLSTAFAAVVRELDSQGVVKLPTSPALTATAASAVELVPRGEDGDGDTYNHRSPSSSCLPRSLLSQRMLDFRGVYPSSRRI